MAVSAFLLALLYAEEAWGLAHLWPNRSQPESTFFLVGIAMVAGAGTLLAFFLPVRGADPSKFPRPWGVMAAVTTQSALITIVTNAIVFVLYLLLVRFDIRAVSTILKDVYLFTLITIVFFHGLLLYIRYMHYLYYAYGGADTVAKPLLASGGLAAIVLIVGLYLFAFDIQAVNQTPEASRAVVSLHVYLRDLYLFSLVFVAYAWHIRWLADH